GCCEPRSQQTSDNRDDDGTPPRGIQHQHRHGGPDPGDDWCLAHPTDAGAVATALAFVLGMRASEIATRTVRHLDGHGTLLDITEAKTEAGERTLKLPRMLLADLAKGKKPDDRLFGEVKRHW